MTKAIAIIGAQYGDEGKGLCVDYFTSTVSTPTAVIRYNGGSQAGHTVQLECGTRHVFSHFGSGTFNNRPTLLSEEFVVHPMMFYKEQVELNMKFVGTPLVYVHPNCKVTTPYDMIINQIIENRRGKNRHGSVGVGFGETFERDDYMSITASDLYKGKEADLKEKLILIRDRWVPSRIQDCQSDEEKAIYEALGSDTLLNRFMWDCENFNWQTHTLDYDEFQNYDLVFEGAQGLLLDQTFGFFPHVTRSNTGTKNIIKILENFPIIDELKVNHITRVYTTRHGAGPLSYEQDFPERIIDNTNHSHLFQGALRYSPLNYDEMGRVISLDLQCQEISYRYEINNIMTMTCLDQLDDTVQFIMGEELHQISKELFIENVYRMHDYVSYGPTRKDVIEL